MTLPSIRPDSLNGSKVMAKIKGARSAFGREPTNKCPRICPKDRKNSGFGSTPGNSRSRS